MPTPYSALVITSISAPNVALRMFAEGCQRQGIHFILIGDRSSPPDFHLDNCDAWSIERQRTMPFALAQLLPERHYGRKNLGYLQAMASGAQLILESDDDNLPQDAFWNTRVPEHEAKAYMNAGWVNLYRCFSKELVWPRGFPLEMIQVPRTASPAISSRRCPIQQGLADGDPDVDAIYRLTAKLPLQFDVLEQPVSLGAGSWCPFNSQNTTWFPEAFPLLYLPSYCSFRMTDIWRSYVATRICWENSWDVLFHNATVKQDRNEHDLMKDFADELIGYQNNKRIADRLSQLNILPGAEHIPTNMLMCYTEFIEMGLIGKEEHPLLEAWFTDLSSLGR